MNGVWIYCHEKSSRLKHKVLTTNIQHMLEEFKEIVAGEILAGLPPLHSTSHQIDLIPCLSLPKKEPHQMSLVESEEVNRQV